MNLTMHFKILIVKSKCIHVLVIYCFRRTNAVRQMNQINQLTLHLLSLIVKLEIHVHVSQTWF